MIYIENKEGVQKVYIPTSTDNTEYVSFFPNESDMDLTNYYTKGETVQVIDNKLKNYYPKSTIDGYVRDYTNEIDDIEEDLTNIDRRLSIIENNGGGSSDVNLDNYYTKNQVDNKFATKVGLNTVADNVNELNERVTELEENGTGGTTDGCDTTELENRVTELEDKTFNNGNSLQAQVYALENRTYTLERKVTNLENGGTSSGEKEVVTIEVLDDLGNITPQQLMEICNNTDKQYIIKLIADNTETFNVINTFKTNDDFEYRINILRYFDTVAEIFYTNGDETVGYNEIYLKIDDGSEGSESTVVFEIDGGIENIDGDTIESIALEYSTKRCLLKRDNDYYEVIQLYRDSMGFLPNIYILVSDLKNNRLIKFTKVGINVSVEYINLGDGNNTSNDIEIMTILNYELTQEQVNYICQNYDTKNILFKGQYQDEDTFDWLEIIRCKIYGKEDDGNWVATIGFSDGVYRYIFNAEKVFNENDELVWQITKNVEDIYEPTIKDVLIDNLATLDGKFREIEVLLGYNNVVNILNGMQSICVLTTRTDIVYSNLIKYIFAVGSDGNNLVKYVWKKQNDNVTFSSEVIGGGSSDGSSDGSDVVKYDYGLESETHDNYITFQSIAQNLLNGKVVYIKCKYDNDDDYSVAVQYNLTQNESGIYVGKIKFLTPTIFMSYECSGEGQCYPSDEWSIDMREIEDNINENNRPYDIEVYDDLRKIQSDKFRDYVYQQHKQLKIIFITDDKRENITNCVFKGEDVYESTDEGWFSYTVGYATCIDNNGNLYKWEFNKENCGSGEINGEWIENYKEIVPTITQMATYKELSNVKGRVLELELRKPTYLTDDEDVVLNEIESASYISPFDYLKSGIDVIMQTKENIESKVTSWYVSDTDKWFVFSYFSPTDNAIKTIRYRYVTYSLNNAQLIREIL